MASIQIQSDSKFTENGITYRTVAMASEKRGISVVIASGRTAYVSVIVKNASHQVWRGMGKQFPTLEAAIENYKSGDVKAMLSFLAEPEAIAETKSETADSTVRSFGFDRCKMSDNLTMAELIALRQQVEADPKSQNPRHKAGKDINLYTPTARRKLDNIAWVITWKLADLRARRDCPQ